MALAATIESLEDVAEHLREHYVLKDGKLVLDAVNDPRVISARQEAKKTREELKALQEKLKAYGDTKPEEIEALRNRRLRDVDEEETNAARMARLRQELDDTKRDKDMTVRERETELVRIKQELSQERIGTRIRSAASSKLLTTALDDAVLYGMRVFRDDGEGNYAAFDGSGKPLLGKSGEDLSIEEWIEQRRSDRPHWFGQSGTGNQGGGAPHQGSGQPPSRPRPKNRGEMSPQEKSASITELGLNGFLALPY